jgi:hypothetical protein
MSSVRNPSDPRPAGPRAWTDVIDAPLPLFGEVTDATKASTLEHSTRFRGSVRMSTARFYTTAEYESMRKEELAHALP